MEKAYKVLALKEGISNREAKALIDLGLVSLNGKVLKLAREEIGANAPLKINKIEDYQVIFEDENITALYKPPRLESYALLDIYNRAKDKNLVLLNRLDKETSGVILLSTDGSGFHSKAKEAFKTEKVIKKYLAIVKGIVAEEMTINKPIKTIKGKSAYSKISTIEKGGKNATTIVVPLRFVSRSTLLDITIPTGRTHQIRVHLSSISHPILNDDLYGVKSDLKTNRLMLHCAYVKILGYEFRAKMPEDFEKFLSRS